MNRRTISLFIAVATIALSCAAAHSVRGDQDPVFTKANEDYNAGRFQEAVDGYQSLVASGRWSANLFYDLGNAWFRLGNFGEAILNYERALALDPHHPEAQANLQIARDEARALELQSSRPEHLLRFASQNQYAVAAAIAFWLGAFGIAGLIFARRRSTGVAVLSMASLLTLALAT